MRAESHDFTFFVISVFSLSPRIYLPGLLLNPKVRRECISIHLLLQLHAPSVMSAGGSTGGNVYVWIKLATAKEDAFAYLTVALGELVGSLSERACSK